MSMSLINRSTLCLLPGRGEFGRRPLLGQGGGRRRRRGLRRPRRGRLEQPRVGEPLLLLKLFPARPLVLGGEVVDIVLLAVAHAA